MNIQQAKDQIKYAISAYLTKNDQGEYVIPVSAQRPLFIMGAPGIGKTDIMKQVAQELGIGLVSYSMTHHTRQSALGLPLIVKKQYDGKAYDVSEYTMSEILSTVYDVVEEDGVPQGILFLDEINCVSETLAPSMLQFLQFKTFGRHKVPDGWVVVTAGNPPEYNNSVREFDIVTWDRLKRIDVEPDFQVWLTHAKILGVHPAILSYLELKQFDFYKVETTVDGKRFVTARGWVDLSQMIRLFEEKEFPVDETLIGQYLQNRETAKNFAIYYDLFKKYRSDYQIKEILEGTNSPDILKRATDAKFDERLALISLLIEGLTGEMRGYIRTESAGLAFAKDVMRHRGTKSLEPLRDYVKTLEQELASKRHAGTLTDGQVYQQKEIIRLYGAMIQSFQDTAVDVEKYSKKFYLDQKKSLKTQLEQVQKQLSNALTFTHTAFGDSQSFFLVLTELTTDPICADFISKHGVAEYYQHNKALLVHDQRREVLGEIEALVEQLEDA